MDKEPKLSAKDYASLVIESGIGSLPVVGNTIQTMYFGAKNEKRFKRLEQFYSDLKKSLEDINEVLPTVINENKNRDQLIGIFESINDEMETAKAQNKKYYYKNLYKNCILRINQEAWNEEEYFLEILKNITDVEFQLLLYFNQNSQSYFIGDITFAGAPDEFVKGSLVRLSNYGLLKQNLNSIQFTVAAGYQNISYKISDLGVRFIRIVFL